MIYSKCKDHFKSFNRVDFNNNKSKTSIFFNWQSASHLSLILDNYYDYHNVSIMKKTSSETTSTPAIISFFITEWQGKKKTSKPTNISGFLVVIFKNVLSFRGRFGEWINAIIGWVSVPRSSLYSNWWRIVNITQNTNAIRQM